MLMTWQTWFYNHCIDETVAEYTFWENTHSRLCYSLSSTFCGKNFDNIRYLKCTYSLILSFWDFINRSAHRCEILHTYKDSDCNIIYNGNRK